MDKIIFFHMNQLGDLLFSLPVLKAVKQKYPNIKTYSVVRKNLAGLLKNTGLVDKVFIKTRNLSQHIELISSIRKEKIDTALMFSESPETLLLAYLCRIKNRIGFKTAFLHFLLTEQAEKTGVPSINNNIVLAKKILFSDTSDSGLYINRKFSDDKSSNIHCEFMTIFPSSSIYFSRFLHKFI